MSIAELESFFSQNPVPTGPEYNHGFLEIIGKESHENIWSKLYAYFLDEFIYDGRYPFLDALCEIIARKTGRVMEFRNHTVKTEQPTSNGRIDIVIKDEYTGNHILIENKVYHYLNNDLYDYWSHFQVPSEKKVGVVLALSETPIDDSLKDKFLSITHVDWLCTVEEILSDIRSLSQKNKYLDDFVKTVKHITKHRVMNDQVAFYFKHALAVRRAIEAKEAAREFLKSQYEIIAGKLGLEYFPISDDRCNFWDAVHHHDIYFTLDAKELLEGSMKIDIIIELFREPLKEHRSLEELVKDEPQFQRMKQFRMYEGFLHFGYKNYTLSEVDLGRFAVFVVEKIHEDFGHTFVKIVTSYYNKDAPYNWASKLLPQ
jgi:hypothetical protein